MGETVLATMLAPLAFGGDQRLDVARVLDLLALAVAVRLLDGTEEVAHHPRSYGKGEQIEDPSHIESLIAAKRQGRQHSGQDRLAHAVPASRELLLQAAERGSNLGSITAALLRLLDDYGARELALAIDDALQRGVPHPNAVRLALERRREQRRQPPPIAVVLPADPRVRELAVSYNFV